MILTGYDAEAMAKVLDAIHSINPMNGIVTKFVDYKIARMLVAAELMWEDEDDDLFEDYKLSEWQRRGGDVRELVTILSLDIEVML